uniref:Uncharacterized protein n=1 Tax=Anguilla anguilla TaxID=7936 RepID=A0A0E9P6L2_ANGAN
MSADCQINVVTNIITYLTLNTLNVSGIPCTCNTILCVCGVLTISEFQEMVLSRLSGLLLYISVSVFHYSKMSAEKYCDGERNVSSTSTRIYHH